MDKFGTLKICPKCGYSNFTVEYVPPETLENISGEKTIIEAEYMRLICCNCRYEHKEAPLDAEDNIGESDDNIGESDDK